MGMYTISEVAEKMGISTHTLRFYDKEGLLPFIERRNGRRIFKDQDFEWLRVLNCLKNTGMPLKEIKQYFALAQKGDDTLRERYEIILKHKESLEDQIRFLQYNMKELEYKEWYYKTALDAGTESIHEGRPCSVTIEPDEIPKK